MKKFFLFMSIFLLLSGCYIPGDFDATLEIDKEGRYRFTYYGDILSLNILRKIAENDFSSQADFEAANKAQLVDLTRGGSFKEAHHSRDAFFRVDYERLGQNKAKRFCLSS